MLPSLLTGRSPLQHQEPHRHIRTGSPCEKEAIQRSCPSALRKRCCFGAHCLSCGLWVFYSSSFFPSLIMSQKLICKPEFFFFLHPFSPLQRVTVPAHCSGPISVHGPLSCYWNTERIHAQHGWREVTLISDLSHPLCSALGVQKEPRPMGR